MIDEVNYSPKSIWLIIVVFSFRNFFITFFWKGNLSITCRLRMCIWIMPILLSWNKDGLLSIQRQFIIVRVGLRSKSITCFQNFIIQSVVKDFWQTWFGLRNCGRNHYVYCGQHHYLRNPGKWNNLVEWSQVNQKNFWIIKEFCFRMS